MLITWGVCIYTDLPSYSNTLLFIVTVDEVPFDVTHFLYAILL